jgi:hypothetical protein
MRYYELVIDGPRGWGAGFLQGFILGGGAGEPPIDAEAEGFEVETLREQIHEILVPSAATLHLLVPADLVPRVRRAVRAAASLGRAMAVRRERVVEKACFRFEFCIFSPEHASRLRRRLEHLPPGARLSAGSGFTEVRDPDARGVEMYAPVHQYEMRGEGEVEGSLEAVLPIYRLCRDEELVKVSGARLIGADAGRAGRGGR